METDTTIRKEKFLNRATRDLFNLKISTIVCDSITADDMPEPEIALQQVAIAYCNYLSRSGLVIEPPINNKGTMTIFENISVKLQKYFQENSFTSLSDSDAKQKSKWFILFRIKQMTDQLFQLLKTCDKDNGICIEAHSLLRSAWEIGVDEIAMNTVLSIDGDVITRIDQKYADSKSSCLHSIHHQSIGVCLEWWKELFGILNNFVNNFFSVVKK
jgi:hypothetical protein